jgi:hypothetical protein
VFKQNVQEKVDELTSELEPVPQQVQKQAESPYKQDKKRINKITARLSSAKVSPEKMRPQTSPLKRRESAQKPSVPKSVVGGTKKATKKPKIVPG